MPSGLFTSDCSASSWAWLDLGCISQNIGSSVGNTVNNAVSPLITTVEWAFVIVAVALIVLVAILAFAPNVKHIVPHLSFL